MKIALDVSAVPVRLAGAGRYVAELARRLPPAGVETTLVARQGDGLRWASWSPDATIAPIVPEARMSRLLYEAYSLGTSAPARHAEVWHAPHYTMPRRGSTPTVVTIHDLTFFTNPEWHERSKVVFFRRAIAYSARHATVLVSVSDFTARQIDVYLPQHAPVVVAPHGVDLERFTPTDEGDAELLASHGLANDVPYVFFLGTLEPRKGLDVLLRAFDELSTRESSVELWLAGQSGWGLPAFESQLERHRAAPRIRRLGFVDEQLLPALLRRASVVAYPSRGEGFGLPVLEAMACGALVVTSRDTVMAEVAGEAATLVRAGDHHQLADALWAAISTTGPDRVAKATRARSRAEVFTWASSLRQHRLAYEQARGS